MVETNYYLEFIEERKADLMYLLFVSLYAYAVFYTTYLNSVPTLFSHLIILANFIAFLVKFPTWFKIIKKEDFLGIEIKEEEVKKL